MIHMWPEHLPGISTKRCTLIGHVGPQPQPRRNILAPEGFEPLTKGSMSNPPTNCTLWSPDLPYEKHTSEMYNYSSTHDLGLLAVLKWSSEVNELA